MSETLRDSIHLRLAGLQAAQGCSASVVGGGLALRITFSRAANLRQKVSAEVRMPRSRSPACYRKCHPGCGWAEASSIQLSPAFCCHQILHSVPRLPVSLQSTRHVPIDLKSEPSGNSSGLLIDLGCTDCHGFQL